MRYKGKNRRHGPDLLIRIKRTVTMTVFAINTILVILISIGKPRTDTMFQKFAGVKSGGGGWDEGIIQIVLLLLLIQLALSIAGLLIEKMRHRRKRDNYSLFLMASIAIAVIGMFVIVI